MKVGIYCRISKEKNQKDKSIEDQSLLGKEFALSNNYKYELYIDEGISGTTDIRPDFQRLLADIVEGDIQIIWVLDDSRIQREPEIRYVINNLAKKHNVQYYTHLNGLVDLYNPENDLMGGVMAEFNKYFVAITKIKVKSVLKRRAKSGRGWGIPPYGYEYDKLGYYKINKSEAKIVKKIYSMSLNGIGVDSIANYLNSKAVPTRYNSYSGEIRLHKKKGLSKQKNVSKKDIKWAGNTVRGILKNTMFYGKKKINDINIDVPSLFSISYWDEVNYNHKINNKNTKHSGGTIKYNYLLNGIIKCGKCGRNYNGKTRENKKDHFYYCMGKRVKHDKCNNRSINIDKIEKFVWDILFVDRRIKEAILKDGLNFKKIKKYRSDLSIAKLRIEKANQGKDNILEMVKSGVLSIEEVESKMIEIRKEIDRYGKQVHELNEKIRIIELGNNKELNSNLTILKDTEFEKKRELVVKYIKELKVFWISENIKGKIINYYILKLTYNVNDITEVYVNGFDLNLDIWSSVNYDDLEDKVYFSYSFNLGLENKNTNIFLNPDFIGPFYSTWFPSGEVDLIEKEELIQKHGKEKFNNYTLELRHKIRNLKKYVLH